MPIRTLCESGNFCHTICFGFDIFGFYKIFSAGTTRSGDDSVHFYTFSKGQFFINIYVIVY